MKKHIMITCKRASFLVTKKEEGKIGIMEQIQLQMHLSICSLCRLFEKQSWLIGSNAKNMHIHKEEHLSDSRKQAIKNLLKNNTQNL
jgi:hypothetical protein